MPRRGSGDAAWRISTSALVLAVLLEGRQSLVRLRHLVVVESVGRKHVHGVSLEGSIEARLGGCRGLTSDSLIISYRLEAIGISSEYEEQRVLSYLAI